MKLKIALAEDQDRIASILKMNIEQSGEAELALHCLNGLEMLHAVQKGLEADIILMDISMPVMDGIEATNKIIKNYPNTKIIMTLRDPIERFNSHVKHHIRHGYAYSGFTHLLEEHPRIVRGSQYEKYVDQWVAAFGEDNVFFLDYRELKQDPESF